MIIRKTDTGGALVARFFEGLLRSGEELKEAPGGGDRAMNCVDKIVKDTDAQGIGDNSE